MKIKTVIFGKKVRLPPDITNIIEVEDFALEPVEVQVNNYIAEQGIKRGDIITYKVKIKKDRVRQKRQVKGGKQVMETVRVAYVRVYLSYYIHEYFDDEISLQVEKQSINVSNEEVQRMESLEEDVEENLNPKSDDTSFESVENEASELSNIAADVEGEK